MINNAKEFRNTWKETTASEMVDAILLKQQIHAKVTHFDTVKDVNLHKS